MTYALLFNNTQRARMLLSGLWLGLHIILTFIISLRLIYRKLAVSTTLSFILLIAAFPIIGAILYFFFGDHRLGRKRLKLGSRIRSHYLKRYEVSEIDADEEDLDVSPFFKNLSSVIAKETGFHPAAGNKINLLSSAPEKIAEIIKDINAANISCFLEFYIIDPQGIVIDVMMALEAAALRGVDCRILADDIGSKPFFRSKWPERLGKSGVTVVASLPVGLIKSISHRSDLRNHRKIILIDQKIGYLGSYNLIDPVYFKKDKIEEQWVDIMARMEGQIISSLASVFNTDYLFDNFDNIGEYIGRDELNDFPLETHTPDFKRDAVMQLIPSGPEMRSSIIYETIVAAMFGASESITIVTPYFVPDEALLMAMSNAAKRGIDVTLIVPRRLDSAMARYAGESNFQTLLESGVRITRYQAGLLHTKAIIIDDDISFIGTVNMDMRSFYLNLELTIVIYDAVFQKSLAKVINNYLDHSDDVELSRWKERGVYHRFKENIFRLASPML